MRTQIFRSLPAFTLIETLVVVGLFAVLAVISTQILFSTLKGSSKSEAQTEVRQNGNHALSVIIQMVRNSKERTITSIAGGIRFQNIDGGITNLTCDAANNSVASNSARLTSDKVVVSPCSITLAAGPPPVVTIGFTVSKNATPTRPEDTASLTFSDQVTLRNY